MRQSFLYGTVILIAAGAITKILGFAHRIVLSRIIGAEGMGLYQMVVPILYFLITITTFGLPVAIAKQIAETEAVNDGKQTKRFLVLSLGVVSLLSLFVCAILFASAHLLVKWMFTDERAYLVLLAAIPVIPIASISAVLRGYFQGKHNMIPTAASQLIEQVIRIALVVVMTVSFLDRGIEYATAGAAGSIVFGELGGLLYIMWQYRRGTRQTASQYIRIPLFAALKNSRQSLQQLFHISMPVTLSRIVGSIAYVLEPMIVPFALVMAGFQINDATSLYGQFAGMAVPLLLFPTFLTYSLSVSLVPAVAEAAFQKNGQLVHRRIYQAMRITLVIGAPCTVLLYIFAEPLCGLMYGNAEVGSLLRELAPFSIFLFFQAPLASALQGLDQANVVLRNTLIGAVMKISAMLLLTSQPLFGIHGAIIALNLNITLVTLLHFASLMKGIGFTVDLMDFLKIGSAMVAMGYAGSYMAHYWFDHFSTGRMLLVCSMSSGLLYTLLLVALRVLGRQDVQRIPWIGEQLAIFFPRR